MNEFVMFGWDGAAMIFTSRAKSMRYLQIAAILAGSCLSVEAAAADAPVTFTPSTKWNVSSNDTSCALTREFTHGSQKVAFRLREFAPNDGFEMTLSGKGIGYRERSPKVRFAPRTSPDEIDRPTHLTFGAGIEGVSWRDSFFPADWYVTHAPPPGSPRSAPTESEYEAIENAVTTIEVGGSFDPPIILATGGMHKPMQVMRQCVEGMVTRWGIDLAALRTQSRPATPIALAEWAREIQRTYPRAMLRQGQTAEIGIRIVVGPDGRPTSCHAEVKVYDPAFEQASCRAVMNLARFEPALDAGGKPMTGLFTTRVVYTIGH